MYRPLRYITPCKLVVKCQILFSQMSLGSKILLGFRANGKMAEVIVKLDNALLISSSSAHFETTDLAAPKIN